MIWLLIVALCLASPGGAQTRRERPPARSKTAASPPVEWPIDNLAVEGNSNYSKEQILAVAGLKLGQMAGKAQFEVARDRLMATGAFESVGYRFEPSRNGKGYAASFQVVEVAEVYPFRFDRLDAPPGELEHVLKRADPLFGPKIPATPPVLDRYAKMIEKFLASRNKQEPVIAKLTPDAHGQLVIVFRPAAPPPSVAAVNFTANSVIPATALQNAIAGVAIGSVYSETRFRQLLDTSVRPLYEERGRIRVAFPKIETEPAKDVNGLVVTVEVAEGESYDLGEVRFQGEGLPVEELRKAGDFKTGDVANFTEIKAGLDRIKKWLGHQGYMHPETEVDRQVHDKPKTVDLLVHVKKGPQYLFGRLTVQGLDIISEPVIRKLWAIEEGAPFDGNYPDYFLQRIREDGVFDNLKKTKSVLHIDDEKRTVDVTLVFQ